MQIDRCVRGFLLGLILILALTLSILSLCPGGIRGQLRFAARRFRIFLVHGGIYVVVSTAIRLAFPNGLASDYGPPALALLLVVVFLILGRDPTTPAAEFLPPRPR